ncbi:leucyl-tRNA synthetase [Larkinella arboricola]|uniref:Leucine--tRNA ligase n=1 Tax=Larkinella arboricola TaxID=643671 RepID=A0A327WYD5_LARAB|nr:class I tRNA ligase family protein [Larkinella arboricola]RAJ94565.1 leucyl-tRNA synthetase [Larkinella arboricola]
MSEYNHKKIEESWRAFWEKNQTYRTTNDASKPKYYILDMFPYPSGAGLHVGHPLGYIASDIVTRYKRLKGFNVLHPMGFDSFGLPAEQYAIQTGQHPAITTEQNIARYIEQLKNIGFSYDWSREVRTSDPKFYKWTQWIFMELFRSWYNRETDQAEPIETLIAKFEANGTSGIQAVADEDAPRFTADEWNAKSEREQYEITLKYRLTYVADAVVNWCAALGTVLANDEVKDGVSERGGYPVEQKLMRQWMMRITAYADRLLMGLDTVDWSESLKEQQRNWIGKSTGAEVSFQIEHRVERIKVFTTRLDTIFGVSFMVLAPEHDLVPELTTLEQKPAVDAYVTAAKMRSERDRMADAKTVSGVFTGSYCINPFNGERVPIYLADYVLAGYGTGAVMAVPSGDQRDWAFAKHFDLPIIPILDAQKDIDKQADNTKEGRYINSGIINGLTYSEAIPVLVQFLEERGIGKAKINYRMRDAVFSRQRYWGEPVPVYFKDGLPYLLEESELPLELPAVDKYLPTETGEPPLARAEDWKYKGQYEYELSTMPGWAGSSWYWYRYMDPQNEGEFADKAAIDYWRSVDLYVGGSEHATGHLLYSRFWNKFMKDRGYVPEEEPFKKLVNQGMILGRSNFVYRLNLTAGGTVRADSGLQPATKTPPVVFISKTIKEVIEKSKSKEPQRFTGSEDLEKIQRYLDFFEKRFNEIERNFAETTPGTLNNLYTSSSVFTSAIHVDVNIVENDVLDVEAFRKSRSDLENVEFITEPDGTYICGVEIEKMSKSKFNVVNPDTIVERYGADTLRLYEMFLGPLTDAKPWNTNGIDGVYRFLKKFWRLFYEEPTENRPGRWLVTDEKPTPAELKVLHKTIRKVAEDIENLSFNTSVSAFMVCVNELSALKCNKKAVLQDLVVILAPFAPHITEELWAALGNEAGTLSYAEFPVFNPAFLVEDTIEYPIQINGKVRTTLAFPADAAPKDIENEILANEVVQKWLEGKTPKKVVVVPKRIVNVVV